MTPLRIYDRLLDGLAVTAGVILVAMAAGIAFDAVSRLLPFLPSIEGVIELTEYGLYAVTLCAAPWALRNGAHITVELVLDALPPALRYRVLRLVDLIGLAVAAALAYGGAVATWRAYDAGRVVFKTFVFPEWWLLIALPVGAAVLALEFALRLAGLRAPRDRRGAPPGQG